MHGEWESLDHHQTLTGVEEGHHTEEALQVEEVGQDSQVKEVEEAEEGEVAPQMQRVEAQRKMASVQHWQEINSQVEFQTR